jgi:3-deoxy-D-manno-octulosonic-acid transferase
MLLLYNTILSLSLLLLSPFIFFKLLTDRRYRIGLSERLGFIPDTVLSSIEGNRPIWFHAASVGEVIASVRLLEKNRERRPERKLLVSTFTPTGKKAAREKLLEARGQEPGVRRIADGVIFIPLDLPFVVDRALKRVNPSALILMETELWPNLITTAGRMGIPVVVVNGRISDRSYGKYWFISPLLKRVFGHITRFLMQSEGDAQRIVTLGAEPSKVSVTGNIKFDIRVPEGSIGFMDEWEGPVLIAGSTHRGEDSQIIDIHKELKARHPALKLVIAPRHLERVGKVEGILKEKGLQYERRSRVSGRLGAPILLLDTLGELASFYKYGDIVFIGGSLVPVGGHNILEPALYGRPVIFGPHMENFRDSARIVTESGGGVMVRDFDELKGWIERLLSDDGLRISMGILAKDSVLKSQGATERTLEQLATGVSWVFSNGL